MYSAVFRPTYLFFFLVRQPVAAVALYGTFAFYQLDRKYDFGLRSGIRNLKQELLLFPTEASKWETFKKIDLEKRQKLA